MPHTLREAAKAVGRDRTTLMRAIRRGILSATRNAATGAWLIEPSELHRVYPPTGSGETPMDAPQGDAHLRTPWSQGDSQGELRELRARLDDAQETIADLRRRLDRADERLTPLLTDQRAASSTAPLPPRRFWWLWRR
jgi:hypothetical protein